MFTQALSWALVSLPSVPPYTLSLLPAPTSKHKRHPQLVSDLNRVGTPVSEPITLFRPQFIQVREIRKYHILLVFSNI